MQVWAGLKDLKVLKTTQSGFVGFIRDKYTSLPEVTDRVFSTSVYARWRYATLYGLDEDKAWYVQTPKEYAVKPGGCFTKTKIDFKLDLAMAGRSCHCLFL